MQRNQLLQNSYSFRSKFKSEFLEFSDHTVTRPFSKKEHLSFFLFFFFFIRQRPVDIIANIKT